MKYPASHDDDPSDLVPPHDVELPPKLFHASGVPPPACVPPARGSLQHGINLPHGLFPVPVVAPPLVGVPEAAVLLVDARYDAELHVVAAPPDGIPLGHCANHPSSGVGCPQISPRPIIPPPRGGNGGRGGDLLPPRGRPRLRSMQRDVAGD